MSENKRKRRKRKRFIAKMIIWLLLIILLVSLFFIGKHLVQTFIIPDEEAVEVMQPVEEPELSEEPEDLIIETPKEPVVTTASILSAGDIILHSPFISSGIYHQADGSYDYDSIFKYIADDYGAEDFTVVNLELTISEDNFSGYPSFRSPIAIAEALKDSNVDMCLLANNHIYDNSSYGLFHTMTALEETDLLYTGTRPTEEEKTYSIQEINGIKVGIFNYVYRTPDIDGYISINAIPVPSDVAPMINTFSYSQLDILYNEIEQGLKEMEAAGVEYTIAYLHWGNEYQTTENEYQRSIADELCELGIDALIGGHPHVIQPVDLLTNDAGTHNMVCVYSMGNHLSNQRIEQMDSMPTGHTEDGLMVRLTLEKIDDGPVALVDADFIPTWVYHTTMNGGSEYYVMSLEDPEGIISEASELNISSDVEASLSRTNEIIGEGVTEIENALPIINN